MTNAERENFYRNSTLLVDHTNESFKGLLTHNLTKQGFTLLKLVQAKQHEIYHLCYNNRPCCMCPPGCTTPAFGHTNRIICPAQLDILLDSTSKLPGHNPNSRTKHCCCPANPNINYDQLDLTLTRCLLLNFTTIIPAGSPERLAVDALIKFRNESYGHATSGKISDPDYQIYKAQIEKSIMVLAKAQGRESEFKQKLNDAAIRPLDETILRLYQTNLMENAQIMEGVKELLAERKLPDCLNKDLSDVTVTEGCDAHFEIWTKEHILCSQWLQDGVEIVQSEKFIPGICGKIHSLDIRNTCLSDKGLYTVRIEDIERLARLNVEEFFIKNLQSVKCIEGETAEFTCEVKEDSLPARWTKNGIYLKKDEKYQVLQAGKIHRLSINNCVKSDTGNYTVNINNRIRSTSLDVIAIQDNRFKQKCYVCFKDPSVYYCHGCQRSMCQDCNNQHKDSKDTNDHIVQHIHDMYSFDHNFMVNVKVICDIKVLNDDMLVIADGNVNQLVTCDITGQQQQNIPLPGIAGCMAVLDNNIIAFTIDTPLLTTTVMIVNIREVQVIQNIHFNVRSDSITYRDKQLFVGCNNRTIKVLNMSGMLTRTIPVSVIPKYICVDEKGRIYYTNHFKLYCIDTVGDTLFTFTDHNMIGLNKITIGDEGHILVLCTGSNKVLRISPDGTNSQIIIKQIPLFYLFPHICYDSHSKSVLICNFDNVYVFKKV